MIKNGMQGFIKYLSDNFVEICNYIDQNNLNT